MINIKSIIVTCIGSVILCSCNSLIEKGNNGIEGDRAGSVTSKTDITDIFREHPYELRDHPKLSPPDSLANEDLSGSVVFAYVLDPEGEIASVDIMRLHLQDESGQQIVSFFDPSLSVEERSKPYPKEVKNHLSWLLCYGRNLEFTKRHGTQVQDTTRFTLPTRIER